MLTTRAAMPCRRQLVAGGQGQRHLGAGGDEDDVRAALVGGFGQDVGAAGQAGGRRQGRAVEDGQVLAGQDQGHRALGLERHPPGLGGLVGVGRADHGQAGDGPQGGQLLDRLVGRAVLAQADAVVGEDEDHVDAHEGGQADGRAHVVGEDEEGGAVGDRRRRAGPCR